MIFTCIEWLLTQIFGGVPVERRTYEILIFNIDKMLSSTNSLNIRCMYAHINKYILPAYQVLDRKQPIKFQKNQGNNKTIMKHS